jgi:hypothetical protein
MKRLIFWFVMGIFAVSLVRSRECSQAGPPPLPTTVAHRVLPVDDPGRAELDDELPPGREPAEGLPVPIVPGTRVSEAQLRTPEPPRVIRFNPSQPEPRPAPTLPPDTRLITGQLSATGGRAVADAMIQLRQKLAEWLSPEVPPSWKTPEPLVDRMIHKTQIKEVEKDYGTEVEKDYGKVKVYEATLQARFTPEVRAEIVETYQHELVSERLTVLAGVIGFILACLAALAGYIRADEATRGYYTSWLRAIAAAGVGASGVLIYQMLT